jgi:8-oxo-dGTP pyrophosphatase MutT (NUDIX family)
MPKTNYFDDPHAPVANSLVVAVAVIVRDGDGRVLMIRRSDNQLWALPGGAQDIGETTREAAVRETREETGVLIEILGLSGIYSDPRHVIAYDDGEVRQEFSIVFRGRPTGGDSALQKSGESTEVGWIDPSDLRHLEIDRSMRLRVEHGLEGRAEPFLS